MSMLLSTSSAAAMAAAMTIGLTASSASSCHFCSSTAFAAVTGNSPALVENVTDAMGSQEYWISQAPATLAAANLTAVREQHIRIIVGTRDGLIEVGEKLSNDLTALGVEHEFTPVLEAPHNIDQQLLYEDFDRMAVYGDLFADFANP